MTLARRGEQVVGTLHLTPHHLIFSHTPPVSEEAQAQGTVVRPRELWITYPIISFCTFRPTPAVSRQPSSIRLRCRDFTFVCFYFSSENKARDVYDSIKLWTCKIGRIEKLYAFTYQPQAPEKDFDGWNLYDPRKEWARLGVGKEGGHPGWRISEVNIDYTVSFHGPQHNIFYLSNTGSFLRLIQHFCRSLPQYLIIPLIMQADTVLEHEYRP